MRTETLTSALGVAVASILLLACSRVVTQERAMPTPATLTKHCQEIVGAPRIERVTDDVWVARGYDLANTILIRTPAGNVVVDAGMTPARAARARADLLSYSPGPTRALIYTHSHIDHVGGASEWVEPNTEIWATAAFEEHFVKQYGLFMAAEARRGARQMGREVPDAVLPCSALGRRVDIEGAARSGVRMPNREFTGAQSLNFGGVKIELVEAHGETDDQLFVWLPDRGVLLAGDNYYHAFPNLYTIRGTRPRPVDAWIASLDAMRRRAPEHLVPSHTGPIRGRAAVLEALTDYRDAIAWVRDELVRAANAGEPLDDAVTRIGLPPHLAHKPYLQELYGQVDWSARAIYGNELGWFDGDPTRLYPLPRREAARREVALMGGDQVVLQRAVAAREAGEARWSVHLLAALRDGHRDGDAVGRAAIEDELATSLEAVAAGVHNTNGRAYLLQSARELRDGPPPPIKPELDDTLLAGIPVVRFLSIMATRLLPERALDVHEAVAFRFSDTDERYTMTVRRGVAELIAGAPLPGTPAPVATVITDTLTWKRLAMKIETAAAAITAGRLKIEGSKTGFVGFIRRFDRSEPGES
ncbi:MAG: alkyl sulfatase dimerization domain-containing protein [Nannocystaceae bacterium]